MQTERIGRTQNETYMMTVMGHNRHFFIVSDRRRSEIQCSITEFCLIECRSIDKSHGVCAGDCDASERWLFLQHVGDICLWFRDIYRHAVLLLLLHRYQHGE